MAVSRADLEPVAPMMWVRGRAPFHGALRALCFAIMAALAHAARPAHAGPFEVITGWEGDSHVQGYGFVALGALIPAGPRLTVPVRASGSFLYYAYDSSGTSVRVRAPGVSLLTGLRVVRSRGSATLMGGGEIRRDHRESGDPALSKRDDTNSGFVIQADGDLALAKRWRAFALGNYAGAARYAYGRGAVRYQGTNIDWQGPTSLFVGVEGVRQGNGESDAIQGGGFIAYGFVPQHLSLALHGGYKESWSPGEPHRGGGYLGVTAYHAF